MISNKYHHSSSLEKYIYFSLSLLFDRLNQLIVWGIDGVVYPVILKPDVIKFKLRLK